MNLYEYSEKNNREMGVFIEKQGSEGLFRDVMTECKPILQSSVIKTIEEPLFGGVDFDDTSSERWDLATKDAESDDVKNVRALVIVVVLIVLFFKYC